MKKVLSVLLAAAMVMGMSVSAFAADKTWGKGEEDYAGTNDMSVTKLSFDDVMIVWDNKEEHSVRVDLDGTYKKEDSFTFRAGDTLYFTIMNGTEGFTGKIDKDWRINVKTNDYIKSVEFWAEGDADLDVENVQKYVKIALDAEYDVKEDDDVDFYFYIMDAATAHNATKEISAKAEVHYLFDNHVIETVDFDHTNDVDTMAKWVVAKGEKGTAIFDFEDEAYFTVKMVSEEAVVFNYVSGNFNKDMEKAFDYEADYTWYNFKGESDNFYRTGELFIPAKDDTFIYAWDGELVEIEAEYVEDYKIGGMDKDGWVIETNELGYYVVSDVEVEIEAEEVEETKPSTDKVNPETGANDFVGAAVALAVVSVAAAGALAFKK